MSRYRDALLDATRSERLHLCWLAGRLAYVTKGMPSARREPRDDETCACGKPATVVVHSDRWGEVPSCSQS